MLGEDMYQENILEHYKHPHNFGTLNDSSASVREINPLCGDILEMQILIQDNAIKDIKFSGKGCAISQASASMLTDEVKGKSIDYSLRLEKENIMKLLGVNVSPARIKCALLPLKALKVCIYKFQGKKIDG